MGNGVKSIQTLRFMSGNYFRNKVLSAFLPAEFTIDLKPRVADWICGRLWAWHLVFCHFITSNLCYYWPWFAFNPTWFCSGCLCKNNYDRCGEIKLQKLAEWVRLNIDVFTIVMTEILTGPSFALFVVIGSADNKKCRPNRRQVVNIWLFRNWAYLYNSIYNSRNLKGLLFLYKSTGMQNDLQQ